MASYSRAAQGLIVVALAAVLGLTAWYGRMAVEDSGAFAVALFGVPLTCAAGALWAERASRTMLGPVLVAVPAVVSIAWSLLTGLGIGGGFLVPSLLLLAAAMFSWLHRQERSSAASPGA